MNSINRPKSSELGPRLESWPLPGKALVTMIVLMTAIGFAGALGQIIVHDIIPTFWGEKKSMISMSRRILKKRRSDSRN